MVKAVDTRVTWYGFFFHVFFSIFSIISHNSYYFIFTLFQSSQFTCHDIEDGSPRHKTQRSCRFCPGQAPRRASKGGSTDFGVTSLNPQIEMRRVVWWSASECGFVVCWLIFQTTCCCRNSLFVVFLKFGTLASDLIHSWNKIQVCSKEEKKWSASLKQDLAKTQAECETQFDHQSLVYLVRLFPWCSLKCQDWKHHWWKVQPV